MISNVIDELIIKNKKNLKGYKKVGLTKLHKSINDFNSFGFKGYLIPTGKLVRVSIGKTIFGKVIRFKGDASLKGMVMSLTPEYIECVIFFNVRGVREGDYVIPTGKLVGVSIGKTIFLSLFSLLRLILVLKYK